MSYIQSPKELPGILGLLAYRPDTAKPLSLLAETLLRGESTLSMGERESIASYVSGLNNCHFCHTSHGAAASHHLGNDLSYIDEIKKGLPDANISPKLRSLLQIADKVQKGGKNVTQQDIEKARELGATDLEIHDTVLIAAAFCMYNRYVDGLGTWAPAEKEAYKETGKRLAEEGYLMAV